MPYQGFKDGLYLSKKKASIKGIEHYGIIDVGNRIGLVQVDLRQPVVVHQTLRGIQFQYLQETGNWNVIGKIIDEEGGINRINEALKDPAYNLFVNNCEHFARGVATGKKESFQLRAGILVAGLVGISLWKK